MPPRRHTLPKSHRRVAGRAAPATGQLRRISRREREEKQRRRLYWGLGIAAALIVVILAGSALNEYWLKPRHVLASVNGVDIRRRDYWKFRAVELSDQANQYASIANSPFIDQSQRQQYVAIAQQTNAEIDKVWGSTAVDEPTLQKMIDDQVYLQSIDQFGITISDQDVQNYIDQRFESPNAPIFTPTPSPTLIPERAEWATQTAVALEATPVPEEASPVGSPVAAASPVGSPELPVEVPTSGSPSAAVSAGSGSAAEASPPSGMPAASPGVAVEVNEAIGPASPEASGSPAAPVEEAIPVAASPEAASPVPTMEPSPTPNEEQARQTATANYGDYQDAVFDRAHMSEDDYARLIARPQIARERINQALTADVGQRAEQVRAAHILVDTKDLADAIYRDVTSGTVDFAQAAKDQSIDSGTAPNGGDLGWFTRGQMVDQFEQVAFSTPPGQISQPVQTQFGWHIIKVFAHEQDRAMTDDQITQAKNSRIEKWLTSRKAELDIESEIEPTPTSSAPQNFVPPPDAPPPPTPTVEPTEAPPSASPVAPEQASPVTVPAEDAVVPAASPSDPIVSPIASPVASPMP